MTEYSTECSTEQALLRWCAGVEERAAGRAHAISRGGRRVSGVASGSYHCEGRRQCAGQMDVWECIAAVEVGEGDAAGGGR